LNIERERADLRDKLKVGHNTSGRRRSEREKREERHRKRGGDEENGKDKRRQHGWVSDCDSCGGTVHLSSTGET
jgi:hypothetical protein